MLLAPMLRVFNQTARYVDQCVVPETIIYTQDGPKEIQYLVNGSDAVINTDGCESIQNVLEHPYEGDLLTISTMHSIEPLSVTPEHPLYILRDLGKAYNFKQTKKRIENGKNVPQWIDAKDVNVRDFIGFPVPTYSMDNPRITEDDTASDTFSSMILQTRKMQVHSISTLVQRRTYLLHSQRTLRHSHS
eukprot:g1991.t1